MLEMSAYANLFSGPSLTNLIVLPLLFVALLLLIPTQTQFSRNLLKGCAFVGGLATFVYSLFIYFHFDPSNSAMQFAEQVDWLPALGVHYSVGIDGISMWLILLTTFFAPIVVLSSFNAIESREKEYYVLLLALQSAMIGAFVALDVFLFYVFWEVMLIPMYFLIGIWGGKSRVYAAMKFFLYTMVGSLLMLVAIFYLAREHAVQFGSYSTLLVDLLKVQVAAGGWTSPQSLLFLAFALAFAIKVPLFPFHTWLPDAHVQAPTAGSVVLAAVLLKMGGYGFIRFAFPLFPLAVIEFREVFLGLGAIAVVYGACVALVQPDIKKLVAYSSVSHMGFVIIGLFSLNALAASGAVIQMLNHGISTGLLFLLVGMIYERRHTREISDFGGLTKVMPVFAIVLLIATFSSIALPGTNGFVGEFLILLGTWGVSHLAAGVAGTGVILGAVYMLLMVQRVMFGPITHPENSQLNDLSWRERFVVLPLVVMIFVLGLRPNIIFRDTDPAVQAFLAHVQPTEVAKK